VGIVYFLDFGILTKFHHFYGWSAQSQMQTFHTATVLPTSTPFHAHVLML